MRAVTQEQLSLETTPKILSGNMAGSRNPLSALSAPTIGAAKDNTCGERSASIVEHQNFGAAAVVLGYRKSGNMRRPTS